MTSMQEIMWYVVNGLGVLLGLGALVAFWAIHRRRPDDTEEVARQRLRKGQTIMSVLNCALCSCGLAAVSINPESPAALVWIMAIMVFVILALTAIHLLNPLR